MPNGVVNNPLVFVSIDRDGIVTIVAHRSEMGTGSRTSIPMIVADEMEADWSRVRIVQAEGDEKKYGNQDTDGSRSLRHHIQPARDRSEEYTSELQSLMRHSYAVFCLEKKHHGYAIERPPDTTQQTNITQI